MKVLIVAKCIVNGNKNYILKERIFVLIVAKCIVNDDVANSTGLVLKY